MSQKKKSSYRKSVFKLSEKIRNTLRRKRLNRENRRNIKKSLDEMADLVMEVEGKYLMFLEDDIWNTLKAKFSSHKLFRPETSVVEFARTIELLVDGREAFRRIIENIECAEKSIHIQMFIWRNDELGIKIGNKLLEAAERGVKVTILKDALGSIFEIKGHNGRGFFRADCGFLWWGFIRFLSFFTFGKPEGKSDFSVSSKLFAHPNVRIVKNKFLKDHSKYFIFDDSILVIGGMNIGNEYYQLGNGKKPRHDFMVQMKSKSVVTKFKGRLKGSWWDNFDEGVSVEFAINTEGRKGGQFEIGSKLSELLTIAQKEIWIEMAYLGDPDITRKMIEAVNRGVKVRLIMPMKANLQDSLNKKIAQQLLNSTDGEIEIYLYPRPLHSKAMIVDKKYVFLGSANFNVGALKSLKEVNVLVNDEDCPFTQKFLKVLEEDQKKSIRMKKDKPVGYSRVKALIEGLLSRVF